MQDTTEYKRTARQTARKIDQAIEFQAAAGTRAAARFLLIMGVRLDTALRVLTRQWRRRS